MEHHFKDFSVLYNKNLTQANHYAQFDNAVAEDVIRFHKSLPGYTPAPLVALREQASTCRIKAI